MNWREYVVSDPDVCHGQARIKGTRISVSVVLDNLAVDLSPEEIISSYPALSREAILAAVNYAAELARERLVPLLA